MKDQYAKSIGETMGTSLGQLAVGIGIIVQVLKQQPGFDAEGFNSKIQAAIDDAAARDEDQSLMIGLLQTTLPIN